MPFVAADPSSSSMPCSRSSLLPFSSRTAWLGFAAAWGLVLTGCSGSSGGSHGGGATEVTSSGPEGGVIWNEAGSTSHDASDAASSTGVDLSVDTASSPLQIDDIGPPTGSFFVALSVTLKNTGARTALSTNPALFSLRTSASLIIQVSGLSDAAGCNPTVSVATGGQIQCDVVFEVPTGQTAALVMYDDLLGDRASASIPKVQGPTACESVSGFFSMAPSSACEECVLSDLQGAGGCATAAAAYHASCTSCSCNDPTSLCTCEASCDSTSCQALFETYMSCVSSACAVTCAP